MNNKLTVTLSVAMFFSIFSYSTFNTKADSSDHASSEMMNWDNLNAALNSPDTIKTLDSIIASPEKMDKSGDIEATVQKSVAGAHKVKDKEAEVSNIADIKIKKATSDISERGQFVDNAISSKTSDTTTTYYSTLEGLVSE
jgi:hypothetical protein